MEVAGLGIGVVGLPGALTSVREATGMYDSYKNAGFESRPHLIQRDAAPILLRQWCESVGYGDEQLNDRHHPNLDDPKVRQVVDDLVKCIRQSLLIEPSAEGKLLDGTPSSGGLQSQQQGPRGRTKGPVRLENYRDSMPRKARLAWAWQNKSKVSYQTQSVAELLQSLRDLVPPLDAQGTISAEAGLGIKRYDYVLSVRIAMLMSLDEFKRELPHWLGTTSTTDMYDNFLQKRLKGTCEWILQRQEFQEWENTDHTDTKVLWIHGPAGYGKTMLCTKIIEHLQSSDSIIAYHFFSSDSDSRADPFIIIRAWTHQLIAQNKDAFELGRTRWDASDRRPASPIDIKELFEAVVQSLPGCLFVVDGLDECAGTGHDWKASYRQSLIDFFQFLNQSVSKPSRLAILSRDEPEIREGLRMSQSGTSWTLFDCLIRSDDVKNDATRFARSIVDQKLQDKSELQRDELSSHIVNRFESMFLGIRGLEGQLRDTKSVGSLHRIIDQAPTRLTDLYDRNWMRITNLQEPDRSRTLAILRWATFALRPMTILEITEALLLTDEECETLSEEELPDTIDEKYIRLEILELCGPLVETRGQGSEPGFLTVHLTHFSVKQYILCHELIPMGQLISNENLRTRQDAVQSNILAITCLRYLNFDQVWEEKPAEEKIPVLQAFRDYAITSWHKHIKQDASNSGQAIDYVNTFFHTENKSWEQWRK
ncbi:hypothetical protein B0J13DRAFT_488040, partial [Dactylonectria estremocensis]